VAENPGFDLGPRLVQAGHKSVVAIEGGPVFFEFPLELFDPPARVFLLLGDAFGKGLFDVVFFLGDGFLHPVLEPFVEAHDGFVRYVHEFLPEEGIPGFFSADVPPFCNFVGMLWGFRKRWLISVRMSPGIL